MCRSYLKNVFRTVYSSIGRYIALISIVMLGVIFYVGLKISTVDMIDTANDFYNTCNLYDYSLVSSLGFDTKDIFALEDNGRMFGVEGAYYQDMVVSDDNKSGYVARIHTLTDKINATKLLSGRMPETADECVVDGRYYDESIIGTKIVVSWDNSEESLNNMAYKELLVTGLVDSPLYLSYQRGTTNVGNGSISSFVYVNFECFSVDYYTQLYIDIQDGYYIYGDEYKELIDSRLSEMEQFAGELADKRYKALVSELSAAQKEYNDAYEEYETAYEAYRVSEGDYNYAVASNTGLKSQLEGISGNYERKSELQQKYYDEADYYSANKLQPELDSMKAQMDDIAATIELNELILGETKLGLDEIKGELDKVAEELSENADIINTEIAPVSVAALTRDDNLGYSTYEENADIVASIAYLFPLFFVLVAALVCITTMSRMIDEERTQIGVFKALGYKKSTIYAKYIFYSLSAAIIGTLLGFYIGSHLFPTVIWKAYMMMYTYTDNLNIIYDYSLLALSLLVAVVVLVGSTVIACNRVLSETPAQMIRPKAPEPGKRVFLERVKIIWDRLPFLHKVSLRNCFRYKKRFFMMLLGIAGCMSLLIIGFGLHDSISSVCDNQYERVETYDYLVAINDDLEQEELDTVKSKVDSVSDGSISIVINSSEVSFGDKKNSVSLIANNDIAQFDGYINLSDKNGKLGLESPDECILSKNLAESLGADSGDSITVTFDNLSEKEYKVIGVYENYVENYIIVTEEGYKYGCGEEPYYNCLLVNAEGVEDVYGMISELGQIDNVLNVSSTEVSRDYFKDVVKSLDGVVYLVILCAAILAFVVLYNLNNINIMERIREIATIKVLGFFKKETAEYVFRENVVLVVLGTIIGAPLGYIMHGAVMSKIKVDTICFDIHVDLSSYLISAGLTILFSVFVELFMRGKISDVNMSESLKSTE